MGIVDAADAHGDYMAAQLSCRYFRPGGVVRGVLELHTDQRQASRSTEILYVVAQIHAHVSVDSNLLSVPVVPLVSPRSASREERAAIESAKEDSYFWEKMNGALPDIKNFSGDAGTCIFQSAPYALLSDFNIAPPQNATREQICENKKLCTREFAIALPQKLCPTFRGTSARVFYVVSITAQTASAAASGKNISVHLPFEVYGSDFSFEPQATPKAAGDAAGKPADQDPAALASPRGLSHRGRSISLGIVPVGVRKGCEIPFELRPSLMHGRVETEQLQKAQTSIFTIGKDSSHLVRFVLSKQFYLPGEVVIGVFDFSRASIPCHKVSATLCLEESLSTMSLDPSRVVHTRTIATFHEFTSSALQTNLRFALPPDALPTIRTDLVNFQWILRFEFTAGVPACSGDNAQPASTEQQTFKWHVRIQVKPPAANQRESLANVPHKLFCGSARRVALL
ncbi:TPA: hypothetical protein N0F65_010133 [Lagenidium giganteum]|uniref:RAB6A-GEF complex partner protein 2 n=1 Tax=Lagenidium giganteum TaxID=4803 RepID=A0AAV2Z2X6_9STRA|nr:TPA: hypothetical protein N0F65_010133 [Lagenidium giganteum]